MDKTISVSKAGTFNTCPRQYNYRYNLNLKRKGDEADHFSLGKIVHAGIEALYKGEPIAVVVPQDAGEVTMKASRALSDYVSFARRNDTFTTLALEDKFETPLEGTDYTFNGVIDQVVRSESGLWVVEHKTMARSWSDEKLAMSNQHPLYENVVAEKYNEPVAGSIYNMIRITTTKAGANVDIRRVIIPGSQAVRDSHLVDLYDTIATIESGTDTSTGFRRVVGEHCKWCEFFRPCHAALNGADEEYLLNADYEPRKVDDETLTVDA